MLPDPKLPTEAELKKGLEQAKNLTLYAGLPSPEDKIDEYRKAGGKLVFFLAPEEKEGFQLHQNDAAVVWANDADVRQWIFDHLQELVGGMIGGRDAARAMKLAGIMKDLVELHNFDHSSIKFLTEDREPMRNMLRNFRYVEDGIPLRRARGLGRGAKAILIAAGPSLDRQWKDLREIQEKVPQTSFIVCGRSYRKAREEGINPDMVVEVEQFGWDAAIWNFAPPPPSYTILCGPATACPAVFSAWPGEMMILVDHNLAQLLKMEIGKDSMDGGNSIIHHMTSLAFWLECDEIALAGVDLSYPEGVSETHAKGTFPSWPREVLKQERSRQDPLKVPGTAGGEVTASIGYKNFCLFLEMQIAREKKKRPDLKIWNFCPNGQKIEGTEYAEISTWKRGPSSPVAPLPPLSQSGPLQDGSFSAAWLPPSSLRPATGKNSA